MTIQHRPSEHEVRAEIRRTSAQTVADLGMLYRGVNELLRTIHQEYFSRDKRLPETVMRQLPLSFGDITTSCSVRMSRIDLGFSKRKSSPSLSWMQPHLLDSVEPLPIYFNEVQTGAYLGTGLYNFVFFVDRRRIMIVDREPAFISVQRHAYERFAIRRRLAPEHVLTTLATDLLPLTGFAAAMVFASKKLKRLGYKLRLALPLIDGLALGDLNELGPHAENLDAPFGVMYIADRTGKRLVPLKPHRLTYRPDPDRHVGALIRTVIPVDMMGDDQERLWRLLLQFQEKYANDLNDLCGAVWCTDFIGPGSDGKRHPFNLSRYDRMVEDLVDLMSSPDGQSVASDRRDLA